MIRPVLSIALIFLPCATVAAVPRLGQAPMQTRQILQAYTRYVCGIKQHGWLGLHGLILPDFTARVRFPGRLWRGQSALRALAWEDQGMTPTDSSVTLSWLHFHGDAATVDVRELWTAHLGWDKALPRKTTAIVTTDWEQTWRRTPGGWRLARFRFIPESHSHRASPATYTVTASG